MIKEKQDLLLNELEELISQLAQQTDSKTTNLQVYIEEQRRQVDAKDRKRWTWFLAIVTSVLLAIGILTFEMWERQYDRLTALGREVTRNAQNVDYMKDQMLKRYELREKLDELAKQRDLVRDKKDTELTEIANRLEKELQQWAAEGKRRDEVDKAQADLIKRLEQQLKEINDKRQKKD